MRELWVNTEDNVDFWDNGTLYINLEVLEGMTISHELSQEETRELYEAMKEYYGD